MAAMRRETRESRGHGAIVARPASANPGRITPRRRPRIPANRPKRTDANPVGGGRSNTLVPSWRWSAAWGGGSPCWRSCSSRSRRRSRSRPVAAAPGTQEPSAYIVVDASTGAVLEGEERPRAAPHREHGEAAHRARRDGAPAARLDRPRELLGPRASRRRRSRCWRARSGRSTTRMHALLMESANDAAFAIAERASGSVEKFAVDAQAVAERLGAEGHDVRRPGRPRRRALVPGRHEDERLRPRDRRPQRARGPRDRRHRQVAHLRAHRPRRRRPASSRTTTRGSSRRTRARSD